MKAERQQKEPQKAEPIQSKRESARLSFVDNRLQTKSLNNLQNIITKNFVKQLMPLTPEGAHLAQMGLRERTVQALNLMNGSNINIYTTGVCYDAVAYTRYLLGANITPNQLVDIAGQAWLPLFDFPHGMQWFNGNIPQGRAVGFRRQVDNTFFHAALALGGTIIRSVNGNLLGAGWQRGGDCDLTNLLAVGGVQGAFTDPRDPNPTNIEVWISNL